MYITNPYTQDGKQPVDRQTEEPTDLLNEIVLEVGEIVLPNNHRARM